MTPQARARFEAAAARYRPTGLWRNETLVGHARTRLAEDGERVAIIDGDRRLTFRQLWDEGAAVCAWLLRRGVQRGEVVSYQLPNWYEAVVVNLAAAMAGLVVHPIVPIYRDAEVAFMLRDCRSKLIFVPRSFRNFDYVEMMERVNPTLDRPVEVVVLRGEKGAHTAYEELLAEGTGSAPLPGADPNAVKMIMYTSGTTGRAKGVLHSHNTLQAENKARLDHLGLTPRDVMFNPSPVTHVTGALYSLILPWFAGVQTVMLDVWEPELGFDMMKRRGCTGSVAATIFLQQLVAVAKQRGETLPHLRFFLCGGAQVPPDLIREASRIFPNCIPSRIYGSTEMPCITAGVNRRDMIEYGAETDGELAFTEARIADPGTGAPVPDGLDGEIVARGPQMFLGYAREEDNRDAFDDEGYFRMGDLGRLVDGRFIVVTGRKKDLIIRAGENISPKEVEDILLGHPDIADIAIVAMPDERTGEAACAFVIPREGRSIDLAEIRRFLVETGIAMQKIPERVELTEEFPRTAVGKVRKDILREKAKTLRKAS